MFVVPDARGRGVARALLHALEARAQALGYTVLRLDTGPRQPAARHLYESEGYAEIENFNANPVATYFGEKPLALSTPTVGRRCRGWRSRSCRRPGSGRRGAGGRRG